MGDINSIGIKISAGMTPDDILSSNDATKEQKATAFLFDTDGQYGYSEAEAEAFNNAQIELKGKKYSIWTTTPEGNERKIEYKDDKYIKTFDYFENQKLENFTKQVWDKKHFEWRLVDDFSFNKEGYFTHSYYAHKDGKKEVITNYQGACATKDETVIKYKKGKMITKYTEFDTKGKKIKDIKTKE